MNDWIVAGINNPTFGVADFANIADMTVDNTQLLSVDEYLKSDFIRNNDYFKDENGKFSESMFRNYYASRAADFNTFVQDEFYRGPALDLFDLDRTSETTLADNFFNVTRGFNPDRQQVGIEGVNIWSDPTLSQREIAKQNKVYNTEAGQFEEYSVDDHTLAANAVEWVKDLFKAPLVLATWDEDGEHVDPITGMAQQHYKGQAKLNDKGTYYYETLGNRSVLGKDVLSVFDTLTVDGMGANKYDFLDSNDLKKSVGGTIMKNVMMLLPMFIPGLGEIYPGIMIAKGLAQSAPMIAGTITGLLGTDTPHFADELGLWATRFSTSTSDWAKEHIFATENIANMISDVALQWGQQMTIARGFGKMRGAQKYIEEARANAMALYKVKSKTMGESEALWNVCLNRFMPQAEKMAQKSGQLGRDLALVYMALISNQDVFEDMMNRGASKREAAIVTLGSTIGMFSVDKYLHLGELFYDDATLDSVKQARRSLRKEFQDAQKVLSDIWKNSPSERKGLLSLFDKARKISERTVTKFADDLRNHTLSMTGKMFGEGLEEVTEEIVTDMAKGLYEVAGKLGLDTSVEDVGAFENVGERYLMNFLGGFIGGGIFYGKEVWDRGTFKYPTRDEDMATLIRNGYADDMRKVVKKMYDEGKTGSKRLSSVDYTIDKDGNPVFYTVTDPQKSQARMVADLVLQKIDSVERVLNENRVNLSDDELFENMVLSERRYMRYKSMSGITNYYQEAAKRIGDLVAADAEYKRALNSVDGTPGGRQIDYDTTETIKNRLKGDEANNIRNNENDALKKLQDARARVQELLSGDMSLKYTRMLSFAIDSGLSAQFLNLDEEAKCMEWYGVSYAELNDEKKAEFITKWQDYVNSEVKEKLAIAYDAYEKLSDKTSEDLEEARKYYADYKKWRRDFSGLLQSGLLRPSEYESRILNLNSRLPAESDYSYENRAKKMDLRPDTGKPETEEQFRARLEDRRKYIEEKNNQTDKEWADAVKAELEKAGNVVDPEVYRLIMQATQERGRFESVKKRILANRNADALLSNAFESLDNEYKNEENVLKNVSERAEEKALIDLRDELDVIHNSQLTDRNGNQITFSEGIDPEEDLSSSGDTFSVLELIEKIDEYNARTEGEEAEDILENFSDTSRELIENQLRHIVNDLHLSNEALSEIEMFELSDGNHDLTSMKKRGLLDNIIKNKVDFYQNEAQVILNGIKSNPIMELREHMKSKVINPLMAFLKRFAEKDTKHEYLPGNVDELLSVISNNYDTIKDVTDFRLDEVEEESLNTVKGFLKGLKLVIYAASTIPNEYYPVGHNRSINEFAHKNASKLNKVWRDLPEINDDEAFDLNIMIADLESEIDHWTDMSHRMQIDKSRLIRAIDPAMARMQYRILKGITRTFTVNGHQYDLLERVDMVDESALETDNAVKVAAESEMAFMRTLDEIAEKENTTIEGLFINHNLLDNIDSNWKTDDNQNTVRLDKNSESKDLNAFTKIIYVLSLVSEPPSQYYRRLIKSVNDNKDVVPIGPQEFSARIAVSAKSRRFREIMDYYYENGSFRTSYLPNTVIIQGVSGSGKTKFVLWNVYNTLENKKVIVSGPTEQQVTNLEQTFGDKSGMSIEDLMEKAVGKETRDKLNDAYKKYKSDNGLFTITYDSKNGLGSLSLVKENIKFNTLAESEKVDAIFIDEATHLNVMQAEVLAEFCKLNGIELYLCGDFRQSGSVEFAERSVRTVTQNISVLDVTSVRAPELMLSMRTMNVQIDGNNKKVEAITDKFKELFELQDEGIALEDYYKTGLDDLKRVNLAYYLNEDLNGDYVTQSIDERVLKAFKAIQKANEKLPKEQQKTFAFVGSESSTNLSTLRSNGIKIDSVLSPENVQGREYDYVVVDTDFNFDTNEGPGQFFEKFLKKFYTLKTRAREGTVLIDNGLSNFIGNNIETSYMAKARSIKEDVEMMRTNKIASLGMINFDNAIDSFASDKNRVDETSGEGKNYDNIPVVLEISTDPNINPGEIGKKYSRVAYFMDLNAREEVMYIDPFKEYNTLVEDQADIYAYGDVMVLDAKLGKKVKYSYKVGDVTKYTEAQKWIIEYSDKPGSYRRNLQALVENSGTEAVTREQKLVLQNRLAKVRSAVQFGHTFAELRKIDEFFENNFNEENWKRGTFELEIREAGEYVRPIGSGFDYGGIKSELNENYYVNIVFSVKNNSGQICRFDLAGMNDPATIEKKKSVILANLKEQINNLEKTPGSKKEEINRLNAKMNALPGKIESYKNIFNGLIDSFVKNGKKPVSYDVTESVKATNTTYFTSRYKRDPLRLSGWINPDKYKKIDFDSTKGTGATVYIDPYDSNSFTERNPQIVVSDVYIYAAEKESDASEKFGISPSVAGKAVVFVTSDSLLHKDELPRLYFEQKKNPESSKPRIRMLVLGNYGISFAQLINNEFNNDVMLQTDGDKKRMPFHQNWVGIRMFASLWNARAALKLFNEAKTEWMKKHDLDDSKVNALIYAQDLKYQNNGTAEQYNNVLSKAGLDPKNAFKIFDEFNNEYCKDIPMFRLAYYRNVTKDGKKGNDLGFHIQRYDVKGSSMYNTDDGMANLCAINPETAAKYEVMLDEILNQLCRQGKRGKEDNITLGLYKIEKGKSRFWGEKEFISIDNESHLRSLKGMIADLFGDYKERISISEDMKDSGIDMKLKTMYIEGDYWSFIPRMIASISRKVTALQNNPTSNVNEKRNVSFNYEVDFKIGEKTSSKSGTMSISLEKLVNPDSGLLMQKSDGSFDNSLNNMLNMIFHGTTDDFQKVYDGYNTFEKKADIRQVMQMDDAMFKYGFLINPIANVSKSFSTVINAEKGEEKVVLYGTDTSENLFTVDVNMRTAGYTITLESLQNVKRADADKIGNGEIKTVTVDNTVTAMNRDEQLRAISDYLLDDENKISVETTGLNNTDVISDFKSKLLNNKILNKKKLDLKINLVGNKSIKLLDLLKTVMNNNGLNGKLLYDKAKKTLVFEKDGRQIALERKKGMTFRRFVEGVRTVLEGGTSNDVSLNVGAAVDNIANLVGGTIDTTTGKTLLDEANEFFNSKSFNILKNSNSKAEDFKKDLLSVLNSETGKSGINDFRYNFKNGKYGESVTLRIYLQNFSKINGNNFYKEIMNNCLG